MLINTHHRSQIAAVSLSVRKHVAAQTNVKAIKFVTAYLLPPPKRAVLAYLGIPLTPGGKPSTLTPIVRKAEVDVRQTVFRTHLTANRFQ